MKFALPVIMMFLLLLAPFGCRNTAQNNFVIIIATTTSVQDSGILNEIIKDFERINPKYTVKPVAVGSGEALEMGKRGDADLLLVHSPEDERTFVQKGYGTNRMPLMYNFFVILGPPDDPARTKGKQASAAFENIYENGSVFVSRSDGSGTHKKELRLWQQLSINPAKNSRYIQTGQGMAETIRITDQKQGYTLSDTGTFQALKDRLTLMALSKEDQALRNEYSIIEVNPARHKKINKEGARVLSNYLRTKGMQIIRSFGKDEFGKAIFTTLEN